MNICLDQIKEEVQNALSEESDDAAAKVIVGLAMAALGYINFIGYFTKRFPFLFCQQDIQVVRGYLAVHTNPHSATAQQRDYIDNNFLTSFQTTEL